jgi:excisionase family DNA binding protein
MTNDHLIDEIKTALTTALDQMSGGDRLLTVNVVAERLSLSRTKVFDLLAREELIGVKLGSARRIRESDLSTYIENLPSGWHELVSHETRKPRDTKI